MLGSNWSFRTKLLVSTLLIAFITVSVSLYTVLKSEYEFSQELVHKNILDQVNAFKNILAPTLLFEDGETAKEIIETITVQPLIVTASLWKKTNNDDNEKFDLLASSEKKEESLDFNSSEIWKENSLTVIQPIKSDGKTLGYFSLTRSLKDLNSRKERSIGFGIFTWLVILSILILIIFWYQSALTKPIQELMTVTEKIATNKDYNIRAKNLGDNEFGRLIKIFNQMMDSLNSSHAKLSEANNKMENQVAERTQELSTANEKLLKEIEYREKTYNELLQTRERLSQQEKLASVGQVSSNIAHELRNPMAAMRNSVYSLRKYFSKEEKAHSHLEVIDTQLSQSDQVIERLLELTRGDKLKLSEINLENVISDAFAISNPTGKVSLETRINKEVQKIKVDPLLFRQVLTNLFTNSMQAMPEGGLISVTCCEKETHIEISIRDSGKGIGIPRSEWKKIFDPLFTQKKEGIGLGLSLCKELMERHDGKIYVVSSSAEGTCIALNLPTPLAAISSNLNSNNND